MIQFICLLVVFVCVTAGGEITLTYGMKRLGEVTSFHPLELLKYAWRAARNRWLWLALPLMATAFYTQLIMLSWEPISLVVPASACNYLVGALGAKYILGEDVTPRRWLGVGLVCLGVVLVVSSA